MDEILIEDKKYVSSKRAAKMTGYAKDYVGQLCREGRVPARLVGRSWYVLESAIQDHRFGTQDVQPKEAPVSWESPRYEAATTEVLPTVNRPEAELYGRENEVPKNLQESWQAWFNNFDTKKDVEPTVTIQPEVNEYKEEVHEEPHEEPVAPTSEVGAPTESVGEVEKDVQIPIHTIYQLPPEELLPHRPSRFESRPEDQHEYEPEPIRIRQGPGRGAVRAIQLTGVLLAIIMVATAVIGSGYFDTYVLSVSPARIIAGVSLYNK